MGISKRYFAEMSQSFASSSVSNQTGVATANGVTSSFHNGVQCMRLNLTGTLTSFVLTPVDHGRAQIVKVQANPNDFANPYSMSYAIFTTGAYAAQILNGNNGYFTGIIYGGTTQTASLHTNFTQSIIRAGAVCFLSSTNHTGNMAVEIFYKVEVV